MKLSQALIIILLVANLIATIWFGINKEPGGEVSQIAKAAHHELPPVVSSEVRNEIFETFFQYFNAADYDSLYNMFGPVAKAEVLKEASVKEFKRMVDYFHSIESGVYIYSELLGSRGNTNIYTMYYSVNLSEKSEFGTKGTLKVTIAVQGNEYQIYGIRLNAESAAQ
ncbi:hypothetical protein [Desulfosudis oleivorans]|nr:hypothetical protein [Desulfosudis oleivorans]